MGSQSENPDTPEWSGKSYTSHPRRSDEPRYAGDECDQPQRITPKTGAITGVSVNGQRISITPPVTFQAGDQVAIVCNDLGDPIGVMVYAAADLTGAPMTFGTRSLGRRIRSYFSTLWLAAKGANLREDFDDG